MTVALTSWPHSRLRALLEYAELWLHILHVCADLSGLETVEIMSDQRYGEGVSGLVRPLWYLCFATNISWWALPESKYGHGLVWFKTSSQSQCRLWSLRSCSIRLKVKQKHILLWEYTSSYFCMIYHTKTWWHNISPLKVNLESNVFYSSLL